MADNLFVACVRTGALYGMDYVVKLRNMVARYLAKPYTMVCLTDQPDRCDGVGFIDVTSIGLTGWWAKMLLFAPEWRIGSKVIYLDLDTVLIGGIDALADVPGELAICENFTRFSGKLDYPCRFGSSVMVIGSGQASFVWVNFERRRELLLARHARYGDQAAIEELYPTAMLLQRILPKGFFCNYRDLTDHPPKGAAVITFGGSHKPHNCPIDWIKRAWE